MMRNQAYWICFVLLAAAAAVLLRFHIIPIRNAYMFLMGLLWLWNGAFMTAGRLAYPDRDSRSDCCRRIHGGIFLAWGAVWIALSLTPLTNQALPMFWGSAPFLALLFAAARWDKNKTKEERKH